MTKEQEAYGINCKSDLAAIVG